MNREVWDVAVVGGGPAGCSAAITLARKGLRVALFEARTYPHDKMCGEFLSPECSGMLAELGLGEQIAGQQPVPIHTVCLTSSSGEAWESPLPGTALGLSRKVLDAALAEQALCQGVMLREAAAVRSISGSLREGFELEVEPRGQGGGMPVEVPAAKTPFLMPVTGSRSGPLPQTIYARSVLAAHGKRSPLDRALGRRFLEKRHPFVAIKAHFHGPPVPGRIELHGFPGGYCGISEIEGGAKVMCLLVDEQVFQAHRSSGGHRSSGEPGERGSGLDSFVNWMMSQNLYLRSWLQWAERIQERWISIAQVPFDPKPAVERDVLMAGDAAGLIAPLAGNGISMALSGGRLAADYLARFLSGDLSAGALRRAYPLAWNRRFGGRIRLGRALQTLMLRPKAVPLALRLLETFPGLGRFLIAHTREAGRARPV